MARLGTATLVGADSGRQAAVICAVTGGGTLLAFTGDTTNAVAIVVVAALHLALGATAWLLPLASWRDGRGEWQVAAFGAAMFVLLALTSWVFDGYASGVGPLYGLVFVWLGLHSRARYLLIALPVAAVGYAGSLLATDESTRAVLSVLVLLPLAALISLLISQYAREERSLRHDLEVRERWRGALMATLAHDVRSPLTSVAGAIEILQDDSSLPPTYRPLLGSAMRQTKRVLQLSTGILEVERVEDGALVLDRRRVPVVELGHRVAELTQPESVVIEADPGLEIDVDPQRIEQVLFNLVNNALRHGVAPVVVSARALPGVVELAVEDHGNGVPASDVPSLFDRFSAAEHSAHSVGLGLWIVRILGEAHHGRVHYEAPRGGARFVVTLPAIEALVQAGPGTGSARVG